MSHVPRPMSVALPVLALLVGLALGGAPPEERPRFTEIDVERINIVEPDGSVKLVISNKTRQTMGSIDGTSLGERERGPGLIFLNERGDEMGGLIYSGN